MGSKLRNASVIVQDQGCGERVPHAAIGPAVDAHQRGAISEGDNSSGWQPLNVGATRGEGRGGVPDGSNARAVVIVIAENVPDGTRGSVCDGNQVIGKARRQRDIAGEDDVTGPLSQGIQKTTPYLGAGVVEVDVGGPADQKNSISPPPLFPMRGFTMLLKTEPKV